MHKYELCSIHFSHCQLSLFTLSHTKYWAEISKAKTSPNEPVTQKPIDANWQMAQGSPGFTKRGHVRSLQKVCVTWVIIITVRCMYRKYVSSYVYSICWKLCSIGLVVKDRSLKSSMLWNKFLQTEGGRHLSPWWTIMYCVSYNGSLLAYWDKC